MTRINCIPPSELTRQHLVAEYRELPRIFGMVLSMVERGVTSPAQAKIPPTYRMGTGHMKFFCDKLEYLVQRQRALVDDAVRQTRSGLRCQAWPSTASRRSNRNRPGC
jgi:hypothetical protein